MRLLTSTDTIAGAPDGVAAAEPTTPLPASSAKLRGTSGAMNWLALRMLTGDRAKYLGLIFAIAFSSFLIAQQASLVTGVMNRTRSQILDVTAADLWVMDPATAYIDEIYSLKDSDVDRVRSISGVRWAVLFFRFVRKNRGLIPAPVICQVSDRGRVRDSGRCGIRRIFSL